MADFKTALEALGQGKIELSALLDQVSKILEDSPKFAGRLLAQLEEGLQQETIGDEAYATLKGRINEYRRAHAAETEGGEQVDSDATVFDRDNDIKDQDSEEPTVTRGTGVAPEEATEIRGDDGADGAAVGSEDKTAVSESEEKTAVAASEDKTAVSESEEKTAVSESEEKTAVADSEEATVVDEKADDKTAVLSEAEKTGADTSGVDFDIMTGTDSSAPSSVPSATGPTGTEWQDPAAAGYAPGRDLGVGDVIKQRFKLLDVLGVGGMGKVFKGIDLLKEEARDKNPYMAIKLLNEDFKSHPEAFISLQRESSRQQKLAHPNIATVYDFDRIGGPGTPVYITMELMEGQPLNTYIKKMVRKQGGLPFEQAFEITRQLGAALSYAHERRLVHSDFKPGNAFLCNDGTVKTLDFGIARAVKNPVTGEAEKTLFDPGKLGALTPAYASLEMLEGEEPDTRDDIYALGCVAYELLTGKHPFNKLPATTARDNGLEVAPVKGLNKKQNRALRHALAFTRAARSQTVEDFIEEFEGKATWHKNPFVIAAGVLLIIGLMLLGPALNYLHGKKIEAIVAEMNSGDRQIIVDRLQELKEFDKADQTTITDGAKNAIQDYFSNEIAKHIDITGDRYSFPTAAGILQQVADLYPESLFLQEQTNEVEFNKKQKITDLYNEYIAALQNPSLLGTTGDILQTIRSKIDPQHPLLTDPRPANAYRLAAQDAFNNGNFDQALTYINSGLTTVPDDARLLDLQTTVQRAIRVAELNQTLEGAQTQIAALQDYKQYQNDIVELANLSTPDASPVLQALATGLRQLSETELDRILKQGTRADAEAVASEYSALLSGLGLGRELTQFKLAHLSGAERQEAIQQIVAADRAIVTEKLQTPALSDPQWETELLAAVRELDSLQLDEPAIVEELQSVREQIAQLYVDEADNLLRANRFDAADEVIGRGERFAPALDILTEARTSIADAKAEFERQQRIADLKEQFRFQTEADRVAEAQRIFDDLQAELGDDDPFIRTQAPAILADSYARLAQRRADSKEFETALQLAEAGLALAPRNALLRGIRDDFRVEVNIGELTNTFRDAKVFTEDEIIAMARKVNEIEQGAPDRYSDFRKESEAALAERINFYAQTDENSAAALADASVMIFPTSSVLADLKEQFQLEPWPDRVIAEAAVNAGELSRANTLLQEAMAGQFAGHPEVLAFQKTLEARMKQANARFEAFVQARDAAGDQYKELRKSQRLLIQAQTFWVDNPDYEVADKNLEDLIAKAPDNPSNRILQAERPVEFGAAGAAAQAAAAQAEPWTPVSSGRECTSNLAGYGKRARAICFDLVNTGWRGPLMVVVPSGDEFDSNFAISKYEISVGDWSKYCALTGECKPETNKENFNDPVTGVTFDEVKKYLAWLSERTGKTYRLPTSREWEYAATVGGKLTPDSREYKEIKGQLNCRVTMGDKILKGTGTASVKSGKSNKWGLKNFIGNVQELVLEGDNAVARGGAFSDAISKCDMTTVRQTTGGDDTTGFRVVLEEAG